MKIDFTKLDERIEFYKERKEEYFNPNEVDKELTNLLDDAYGCSLKDDKYYDYEDVIHGIGMQYWDM